MTIRLEKSVSGIDPRDALLQAIADRLGITPVISDGRMQLTRAEVDALGPAGILMTPLPKHWEGVDHFELSIGQPNVPCAQTLYLRDIPLSEEAPRGTQLELDL